MHSLEEIKFMNTPEQVKLRQTIARRLNNASQKEKERRKQKD